MTRFAAAAAVLATTGALLLAATGTAAAQSAATGTVKLNGTVPVNCTVAVTDLGATLNLAASGTNTQVGTVVETCNDGAGYTVNVTSANGGKLTSSAPNAQPISYTTSYDGQQASGNLSVTRSGANFGRTVSLLVTVNGNPNAIAGAYADTLTIAIVAK